MVQVDPIDILPDEHSSADDWGVFYKALVKVYGKPAPVIFMERWSRRGKADVNQVEKATGLKISDKNFIASLEAEGSKAVDYVGGFFNTLGTGSKVMFYGSIALGVLIIGGITIKVLTMSTRDIGTIAGTAARAAI